MTNKSMIYDYIDSNRKNILDFLKDMVSKPSINKGEGGDVGIAQDWLAKKLKEFGFDNIDEFSVDKDRKYPNVCAVNKGGNEGKNILFNGHMDVVDIGNKELWFHDPFSPIVKDGKMFGRGTSDDKGGITSAVWAMKAIKDCGIILKGDVTLQSVAGEESQMAETLGTVQCIKHGYKGDFAIVCEPTDMELHIISPALLFFELIVIGKGVHASARNQVLFPQPYGLPSGAEVGVDAFKKSLKFVNFFYDLEQQWNHRFRDSILGSGGRHVHDKQGIGIFTINPSIIEGGEYLGSVPCKVKYLYCVWYPDNLVSKDEIIEEIKQGVKAISSTDDWLKKTPPTLNIPILHDWPGFKTPEEHPGIVLMKDAVLDALGKPAVISGFKAVCDATYLNKYNIPSVVFGPGSVGNSVHGENEYIKIDDVINAAKVYASIIIEWCK